MGKNIYKTASGRAIDMDNLRLLNEGVVAVGNMQVNARGDQVLPDGTIIKTRNQIMQDHNRNIETVVRYSPYKKKSPAPVADGTQAETPAAQNSAPAVESDGTLRGSLASSVSIDLLDSTQPPVKTLKRI